MPQRVSGSAPLLPEAIRPTLRVPVQVGCYMCGNGFRKPSFPWSSKQTCAASLPRCQRPVPETNLPAKAQNPESPDAAESVSRARSVRIYFSIVRHAR